MLFDSNVNILQRIRAYRVKIRRTAQQDAFFLIYYFNISCNTSIITKASLYTCIQKFSTSNCDALQNVD